MTSGRDLHRTISITRAFEVVLEPETDGGFHAYCTRLRGCHSYGRTEQEALENMTEAMESYLDQLVGDFGQESGILMMPDEELLLDGKVPEKLLLGIIADSGMTEEEFMAHVEEALNEQPDDDEEAQEDDGMRPKERH